MPTKLLERREYAERLAKDLAMGTEESVGLALRKGFTDVKVKQTEDHTLRFIISTGSIDRDHDTINPHGWMLDNFKKNPVVLFAHDHRSPPVARSPFISVEGDSLIADAIFTPKDVSEFGDMIYQMYLGGFMNATSVGFMPDERVWSEEQGGIKFLTQELLEFSAVPVPANPEALQIARSKGINISPLKSWAEQLLDEWTDGNRTIGASRKQLERMLKEADDKKQTISIPDEFEVDPEKQKELRQRNIWEPRIKAFCETGAWDEKYGPTPNDIAAGTDKEGHLPEFLAKEYQERMANEFKAAIKDIFERMPTGAHLFAKLVELTGVEEYELATFLGEDAVREICSTAETIKDLGLDAQALTVEGEELRKKGEELEAVNQEITDLLEEFDNYKDGEEHIKSTIEQTEKALADMTAERDELLFQLAENLVNSERGVDPARMVRMFGDTLAKAIRGIIGKVD